MAGGSAHGFWSQERIVLALAVVLFAAAVLFLPGFRDVGNLISIVHSVSVLGLLAVGMAIVIIGRGIDLSAVAIMAMSAAWYEVGNWAVADQIAPSRACLSQDIEFFTSARSCVPE